MNSRTSHITFPFLLKKIFLKLFSDELLHALVELLEGKGVF